MGIPGWVVGIAIASLTALVIFGGIKSIASVCEKLVPFMALFYEQDLSEFDEQKEKPSFANAVDEWVRKTTGITP